MYNLKDIPFDDIKKNTNCNPLLLQEMAGAYKISNWGKKYDIVCQSSIESQIYRTIKDHTCDTFSTLYEQHSALKEFADRIKKQSIMQEQVLGSTFVI